MGGEGKTKNGSRQRGPQHKALQLRRAGITQVGMEAASCSAPRSAVHAEHASSLPAALSPPPAPAPCCRAHSGPVWSLAALPDASGFVSGSADHDIKFWEWGVAADPDTGAKQLAINHTRCAGGAFGPAPCTTSILLWGTPGLGCRGEARAGPCSAPGTGGLTHLLRLWLHLLA